jgi:uncharacterized protein YutE (UPF0331/DUF86 family)
MSTAACPTPNFVISSLMNSEKFSDPCMYLRNFSNFILSMKVVPTFENIASFRNLIVHYYERVDDAVVYGVFKENLSDFDLFVDRIIEYLGREEKANLSQ